MMRFHSAVNSLLAVLIGAPALTLGLQHNESLERALQRTSASLEELARIEKALRAGDPAAIADAVRATEPPLATSNNDPAARDTALTEMRGAVSRLQHELDELEGRATAQALAHVARIPTPDAPRDSAHRTSPELTHGLDDTLRRRLGERVRPVVVEAPRAAPTGGEGGGSSVEGKVAFESGDYAADSLRLGRAHYRQGEYDKALEALNRGADAESLYWKARCFEKLARPSDAISAYNQVLALPDAGYVGQRAKEDLEFLEWRLTFERTRAKTEERKP